MMTSYLLIEIYKFANRICNPKIRMSVRYCALRHLLTLGFCFDEVKAFPCDVQNNGKHLKGVYHVPDTVSGLSYVVSPLSLIRASEMLLLSLDYDDRQVVQDSRSHSLNRLLPDMDIGFPVFITFILYVWWKVAMY